MRKPGLAKGGGNRKEEANKDKNEKYFDFFFPFSLFSSSGKRRVLPKLFFGAKTTKEDEMSSFARTMDNSIIDERAHAFKTERLKMNTSEKRSLSEWTCVCVCV